MDAKLILNGSMNSLRGCRTFITWHRGSDLNAPDSNQSYIMCVITKAPGVSTNIPARRFSAFKVQTHECCGGCAQTGQTACWLTYAGTCCCWTCSGCADSSAIRSRCRRTCTTGTLQRCCCSRSWGSWWCLVIGREEECLGIHRQRPQGCLWLA